MFVCSFAVHCRTRPLTKGCTQIMGCSMLRHTAQKIVCVCVRGPLWGAHKHSHFHDFSAQCVPLLFYSMQLICGLSPVICCNNSIIETTHMYACMAFVSSKCVSRQFHDLCNVSASCLQTCLPLPC